MKSAWGGLRGLFRRRKKELKFEDVGRLVLEATAPEISSSSDGRVDKTEAKPSSEWSREDNVWIRRGRYEVLAKLGEGGFSRVFKAKPLDVRDGCPSEVAIKITRHPGPGGEEPFRKRRLTAAEKERHETAWIELLCHRRANGHPNVVKLFDHAIEPDATALVMEYVPRSLFEVLYDRDTGFDEEEIRLYAHQILSALEYIHSRGVVHRDVKLENILLSADGTRAVLCDFGLAAFWEPGAKLRERCGSPAYASPEILGWNSGYNGPEVDAWSAGVAIYLMRNARYPFWSDDPGLLPMLICTQEPDPMVHGVSFSLAHLTQCLLAKDSYYRLDVSQALQHEFFESTEL
jgi:serine/threonine protein kinase